MRTGCTWDGLRAVLLGLVAVVGGSLAPQLRAAASEAQTAVMIVIAYDASALHAAASAAATGDGTLQGTPVAVSVSRSAADRPSVIVAFN